MPSPTTFEELNDSRLGRPNNGLSESELRVSFVLSPRFTILPFAGFLDALRLAADEGDRSRQIYCQWEIVGPTLAPVTSSSGVEVTPWRTFPDIDECDCIVVVGGLLPDSMSHPPETLSFLQEANSADKLIVSLCQGNFTLALAGVLDGRRCATHYRHDKEFRDLFPEIEATTQEILVKSGNIITCPGGTAAIDAAFEIISHRCGQARATKGLADMIVERPRAAFSPPRMPFDELARCGDLRVERAVAMMRQNLSENFSISELADRVGCSASHLSKAFRRFSNASPAAVWRSMRLRHAHWRVLNSSHSITEIGYECGFSDSSHFIRWFRKSFGETPNGLRNRMRSSNSEGYELEPQVVK
ncbi:GlxA family transcriptional regulator [Leisingera sp. ANG-DT]|uniref:GlxA family transcriptional regulator n=1 Tax=Leisingera sp. ANG-DT TaxID=1577897 RepID=UPI0009DCA679|nr:GlxA family transcriptional regulator [Leisingera sp. ANG-DT]